MKQASLLFLMLLTFRMVLAQEEKPAPYIGLQFSPNLTYRVLSNNTDNPAVDDQIEFLNNREKAALGFRVAVVGGTYINKNFNLELGISYLRNCVNYNLALGGSETDPRRGFVSDQNIDEADLKTCYDYLGIPVRLVWSWGTEYTRILASVGFAPQILMNDRVTAITYRDGEEVDRSEIENTQDVNGFNLSPQLGLGIQLRISEQIFVRGEGIARFGALDIDQNSMINSYLYSSELNLAIHYRLR